MTEANEQTLPETASGPETQSPAMPEKKPVTWEAAVLLALAFPAPSGTDSAITCCPAITMDRASAWPFPTGC